MKRTNALIFMFILSLGLAGAAAHAGVGPAVAEDVARKAVQALVEAPDRFDVSDVRLDEAWPPGAWVEAHAVSAGKPSAHGISRVRVALVSNSGLRRVLPATVVGSRVGPVVVAREALTARDRVPANSVVVAIRALDKLRCDPVRTLKDLHERVPRRALVADTLLCKRDLIPEPVVARGQMIDVEVRRGGLILRARVKALEDAARGETVRLMNMASRQRLEGRVEPDGRVVLTQGVP